MVVCNQARFLMDEPWSKKGSTSLHIGRTLSKPNFFFKVLRKKQNLSGFASTWMAEYMSFDIF